jgi:hypothetical protein
MRLGRREFIFLVIWVLNPIAVLMYQNCSTANLQKMEPEIRPILQEKIEQTAAVNSSGR